MKKFFTFAAKVVAIVIVAALLVYGAIWSLESIHRIIWFAVVVITAACSLWYLSQTECVGHIGKDGLVHERNLTLGEKVGVLVRAIIGLTILSILVWVIGYGLSSLLGWNPDYWEVHFLIGGVTIAIVAFLLWAEAKLRRR